MSPPSRTRPGASSPPAGGKLRTLLAFSIFGFVTATVAPIVYAACYLIVPYPRPIVVLIETLPAIAVKFLVPHLVPYVPAGLRPVVVAAGLLLASALIDLITPNVHPPVRILLTLLAAAATAASEVLHLGLLRHYGKAGLAGWGLGTGAGAITVAAAPYIITYKMGLFLRSAVHYTYYLIPAMLVGYYLVLPRSQMARPGHDGQDMDLGDDDIELLAHGISSTPATLMERIQKNLKLFGSLTTPYMLPLFVSAAIQGIVFPGVTRGYPMSSSFEAYPAYSAAYGSVFHLGNMAGRVFAVFARSQKGKSPMARLGVVAAVIILNASFLFITLPLVVFVIVLVAGFLCGMVYSNTFVAVLEDSGAAAGNREFALGVVGMGETEGILIGAFVGAALEASMCSIGIGSGQRWCHSVR